MNLDKEDVVPITDFNTTRKKNEIMSFAAPWTDLEIIILSKVSQKE